jgi:hypothetical protein
MPVIEWSDILVVLDNVRTIFRCDVVDKVKDKIHMRYRSNGLESYTQLVNEFSLPTAEVPILTSVLELMDFVCAAENEDRLELLDVRPLIVFSHLFLGLVEFNKLCGCYGPEGSTILVRK